jgi:hypothetical protein
LPDSLLGTYFYHPSEQGYEAQVAERLDRWRAAQRKALDIDATLEPSDLADQEIDAIKKKHTARRSKPS